MAVNAAALCAMVGLCSYPATAPPPEEAACLIEAYPKHICDVRANLVFWCDGEVMLYDSMKRYKDHDDLLNHADIQDQLVQRYPIGRGYPIPLPVDFEPGRVRNEPFFLKMYGATAREVDATLMRVHWMPESGGKKLKVTGVNNVDKKLAEVSRELESMPEASRRFVEETSGTFVWRRIKGTGRLSMHSFAIAVDVGVRYSDYWRWNKPLADGSIPYKNRMPLDVVEVFEKHGFIWGGKWYHFDTMHFEYRPELIACGVGPVAKPTE
jgi:hypothetical protein